MANNSNPTQDVLGRDIYAYLPDGQEDIHGSEHVYAAGNDVRNGGGDLHKDR